MVLASCVLNIHRQLAGGNAPRAENSGDDGCKQRGLDGLFLLLHNIALLFTF
jgi:hypothetical protein